MTGNNLRKHLRTPLKVKFKIWHDSFGELVVATRDVSDGGVFLVINHHSDMPAVGTELFGQVQDMMADAPIVRMKVVRMEPMGVGLRFLDQD